jgi:hypothetical protein
MTRSAVLLVLAFSTFGGMAAARPRPQLTPQAAALLQAGGLFLVAEDNLAVPLAKGGKPVPFLAVKPERFELIRAARGPDALVVVDGDVYRLRGAALSRVASQVATQPAASDDASLVASIDEKRVLKLTRGENSKSVSYRRDGRWELEQPYVTPDGAYVLVAVHDYTHELDAYSFILVDAKSEALDEVTILRNFVPGTLRQPLSPTQVLLQMFAQGPDDSGFASLTETDRVVFDFKSRKLEKPPASALPGLRSPDQRASLLAGKMLFSDDKSCGGDQTLVFEEGRGKPASFNGGANTVVSVLDFLPDGSGLIGDVLNLKTCKHRGVIIPADGGPGSKRNDERSWKPFALPARNGGRVLGRVLAP